MPTPAPRTRKARASPPVVDLAQARDARRLRELVARCRAVDEVNRKSLARLFQSGIVFTRTGARLGRDLLLAHQYLLRVADLLARISELPDGSAGGDAAALYAEAQGLLARTADLTARSGLVLARGS
jgi:DNA-binding transcriptional regulator PaaX